MDNVKVADDYKDRLFRRIFNDKEKLLELYNTMNSRIIQFILKSRYIRQFSHNQENSNIFGRFNFCLLSNVNGEKPRYKNKSCRWRNK